MFCENCGSNIEDGSRFCPECGAAVRTAAAPAQEAYFTTAQPQAQQYQAQPQYQAPNYYQQPQQPQQGYYQQPQNTYQGQPTYYQQTVYTPPAPAPSGTGFGVAGFVLSLIGLLSWMLLFMSLPFTILGLIFSIVGRSKLKRNGGKTGLATAGLVISIIAIVLTVLIIMLGVLGLTMMTRQ